MQLNDLVIFRSVAEHSSFTKAAVATNTVQSNVTARIKYLESEFNTRLFERTSRKIALTPAGTDLLKTAKEVLLLIDDAKRTIGGTSLPVRGLVKIGCIHTTAALRVPGILQNFGESYPEVEFRLKTGTSAGLIKEVLTHQLDGAFVAGVVHDERLTVQPILTEELGIVTSSLVQSVEQLQNQAKAIKLIVFSDGCSYRRHFEQLIKGWKPGKVSVVELDTLEGILNAVENNTGVTLLPVALIEKHYKYKSLRVFRLPDGQAEMKTLFIKRTDAAMSEAYRKFFELITGGYKSASA